MTCHQELSYFYLFRLLQNHILLSKLECLNDFTRTPGGFQGSGVEFLVTVVSSFRYVTSFLLEKLFIMTC